VHILCSYINVSQTPESIEVKYSQLSTSGGLRAMESKHLTSEQVLSSCQTGRKLELLGHVIGIHDFV
jgi:hypothetical protein